MKYSVFSAYSRGYAHVREGMPCQDYAAHYIDAQERYIIATACDGHSDKNCFRSDRGARFGCEAAIEVLKIFFESYFSQDADSRRKNLSSAKWQERQKDLIRRYFIPLWNQKVKEDLAGDPFTEKDLAPLSERTREIYRAGYTEDIYGATLQTVAVCEDFHLIMQIGDGVCLTLYPDGCYDELLPQDEKSETGGPASICDRDLLNRPNAFRILIRPGIPVGMFATSDGMGDIPPVDLFVAMHQVQKRVADPEDPSEGIREIDESPKAYIQDMVAYYADKDHGPEDDCSLAGFVLRDAELVPPRLMRKYAESYLSGIRSVLRQKEDELLRTRSNRKKYLRDCEARYKELLTKKDLMEAELAGVEQELESLEQLLSRSDEAGEDKPPQVLEALRKREESARRYLQNARTEPGKPIPHGVLADPGPGSPAAGSPQEEPAPAEQQQTAGTGDRPDQNEGEAGPGAEARNEGTPPAGEDVIPEKASPADAEGKPQPDAGNENPNPRTDEGEPEEPPEEPANREDFQFPVPPEMLGLPAEAVTPQQALQPEPQPARRPEEESDIQPEEDSDPQPEEETEGQRTAGSAPARRPYQRIQNTYVVPEDQLLSPD